MKSAVHHSRVAVVADGVGDDSGYDIVTYRSVEELQFSLTEDFGIDDGKAREYAREGVLLVVRSRRHHYTCTYNSNGIYGRLDVGRKRLPDLESLKRKLIERVDGANHV